MFRYTAACEGLGPPRSRSRASGAQLRGHGTALWLAGPDRALVDVARHERRQIGAAIEKVHDVGEWNAWRFRLQLLVDRAAQHEILGVIDRQAEVEAPAFVRGCHDAHAEERLVEARVV